MSTDRTHVYRSDDAVVAGVLGGFAEYFDVEPTIFRLAIVFLIVATGIIPGLITYLVAILIMPKSPAAERPSEKSGASSREAARKDAPAEPDRPRGDQRSVSETEGS